MSDFLLELRSEEIPARMQAGARAELEGLLRASMEKWNVPFGELTIWSTPRRLALIARDLPAATEPVREEVKGPRTSAPAQALEGFLRKVRLTQDQLTERDGVWFAITDLPGFDMKEVLQNAIFSIVWDFSWPKSMRWGGQSRNMNSLRWVRPLSGIVAILGDELVEIEIDGIRSGYATKGHRFHHPGDITIGGAHDYADKLRACHVIVDHEERQDLIRARAAEAARAAGLELVADEGLVVENAGLTEWPVPLLGRFDEQFLGVPPEVIQLTARTNQKYFVCTSLLPLAGGAGGGPVAAADDTPSPDPSRKREGELANAFVCIANIEAADGGLGIVAGNRKVLAARLGDARFFWQQDRRKTLEEHARGLERITFHDKLGTVADKVERVAKLARWLVEEGIVKPTPTSSSQQAGKTSYPLPHAGEERDLATPAAEPGEPSRSGVGNPAVEELAALAEQAALLCKADLVTEMVGEFPELQGVMGGYYARAEGLPDAVADAIRDHYKPVGQGDEVPTAPVTVAVSLADKLDTLCTLFISGERATGSRDPYGLRRSTLSIISIILENALRLPLHEVFLRAVSEASQDAEIEIRSEREAELRIVLERFGKPVLSRRTLMQFADFDVTGLEIEALDYFFSKALDDLPIFFADRLKVQQREAGVRHDLIDAVFALGGEDDLVRLLARVRALQAFIGTGDGANLLVAYKRAANILRKEGFESSAVTPAKAGVHSSGSAASGMDSGLRRNDELRGGGAKPLSYTPELAEKALIDALESAGPRATAAVEAEDFAGAMAALASLRAPIDAFFDHVTVNDPDADKRAARLALLDRFRVAVHEVADFSKIEG